MINTGQYFSFIRKWIPSMVKAITIIICLGQQNKRKKRSDINKAIRNKGTSGFTQYRFSIMKKKMRNITEKNMAESFAPKKILEENLTKGMSRIW